MRKILRIEVYFLFITVATFLVMVGYEFGMNHVFRIDVNNNPFDLVVEMDMEDGGESTGSVEKTDSSFVLHYNIRPKNQWPYVTLSYNLPSSMRELDFSHIEEIEFKARHITTSKNNFRLTFRNFNPDYFDINRKNLSWKFNETSVEFDTTFSTQIYKRDDFNVPAWWVEQMGISREYSRPNFNRIRKIQWSTGGHFKEATGSLEIMYIEIRGKWVEKGTLYGWMLYIWMISVIFVLLARTYQLAKKLKRKDRIEAELQKENIDLHHRMSRDPLTGALNRNTLGEISKELIDAFQRKHVPFTACIIDVDHFKKINDTQGHLKGDEVLKNLVKFLHESMKENQSLIRWGGEEFMLFTANSKMEETLEFVNKCRVGVKTTMGISFSAGAGQFKGGDFREFINQVDLALLKAKENGRNQVYQVNE